MPPSVFAGDAHRPIPPFDTSFRASIHGRSSRFSVNTPLACATQHPIRHDASSHSMEKPSGGASTISTIARPPKCCTHSRSKPVWSSRTSISRTNPTKSQPPSNCSVNSTSRTASSRSMPCTAKKTFEAAAQAEARLVVQLKENQPTLLQNAETACASQQPVSTDTEVTVARNRHETRTVKVFRAAQAVATTEWQSLIKLFVCVSRDVLQRSAKDSLWSSCRRKLEMTPGAQCRNDTPPAA